MSNYDHTLSLTVPATLLPIAQSISRALDPDVGGSESWQIDGDNIFTSTPCTASFYEQAMAMLSAPEMLHYAVTQDYAARWADLTPPTLEECQAFCAAVVLPVTTEE